MNAPEHADLPLPDYDHLSIRSLGHRIRSLTADELIELLRYEKAHADRPAVVQFLEVRLRELAAGENPTGRSSSDRHLEWPETTSGDSAAGPATTAPSANPPPHGTPAQPARPKANKQTPR
ncbi:MAG: hypothetical protein ACTHKL_19010 [Streptosporangiaceae bacterium]